MKKTIKIGFVDTFDGCPQFFMDCFTTISRMDLQFIRDDDYPDILFFGDSNFGSVNRQQKYLDVPVRIFYTGENIRPNGQPANYGLGFDHIQTENYLRLPLWVLNIHYLATRFSIDVFKPVKYDSSYENRRFCGFVQSNPNCQKRNEIFHLVNNKIAIIDSAGPLFNNTGFILPRGEDGVLQKLKWLSNYKFTLAAENGQFPGYITEKLLEAKLAGTIPIYYGSETIALDFNPKSFIDYHMFADDNQFIRHVERVNSDTFLYKDILEAPIFDQERLNHYNNILYKLSEFLLKITRKF